MMRRIAAFALWSVCLSMGLAAAPADAGQSASWGAIASRPGAYGYAFNLASRDAAERTARAQCERMAGRAGTCDVRVAFDRSCGALATGNFGEWGAASGATADVAGKAAIGQCEGHLPTEPCKVVTSVCSGR